LSIAAIVLPLSQWARGWVKVKVAKHLFEHRYDYRAEWLGFTETLGRSGEDAPPLSDRIVKALSDISDAPGGLLLVAEAGGAIGETASYNWAAGHSPASDSSIADATGHGHDQTRKNSACRAQRWAGCGRAKPVPLLAVSATWVACSASRLALPRSSAAAYGTPGVSASAYIRRRSALCFLSSRRVTPSSAGRSVASRRSRSTAAAASPMARHDVSSPPVPPRGDNIYGGASELTRGGPTPLPGRRGPEPPQNTSPPANSPVPGCSYGKKPGSVNALATFCVNLSVTVP